MLGGTIRFKMTPHKRDYMNRSFGLGIILGLQIAISILLMTLIIIK